MNNSKALFLEFVSKITIKESREEIQSMGYVVFESLFGLSMTDILADKSLFLSLETQKHLNEINARLNKNEPLQYILGEADFYGRKFFVNSSVLIPRPETEELVREVVRSIRGVSQPSLLDIGTGSGCIPITLALELHDTNVLALDISHDALVVAKKNALKLQADVTFLNHDILTDPLPYKDLDAIVSNPPYITQQEKNDMNKNVMDFEPHLALFVPDSDPLLFYKAIGTQAKVALKQNGLLVVEINAQYGKAVAQLFTANGFIDIQIIKDLSGKDRIVKGVLSSIEN